MLGLLSVVAGCVVHTEEPVQEWEPVAPALEIRVGVELIAADAPPPLASGGDERRGESAPRPPRRAEIQEELQPPRVATPGFRPLTKRQIAELPTASERVAFRLLHTLVGEDGDRLPRELGWSYLLRQIDAVDRLAGDPWADDREAADDAALQEIAPRLVGKAVRRALREVPIVRDVELWFQDFKVESLPLSGTWLDGREERRELGHLSLRLQDGHDPLRVTYSVRGWRIGASRDTVRAGFSAPLGENLSIAVTSTFDHAADKFDAMAELKFAVSARTRLLLTFGNQVHVFPGPTLERAAREEFDGNAGVMAYVETIF